MKPSIFIGSSSEALPLAKSLRDELAKQFLPDLWSEHLFELGEDTLTNLLRFVQCYDFAVLVISDDDVTNSRRQSQPSPRDNVILELGLFLGALGRRRAFVVVVRTEDGSPKVPTDLLGNNGVYLSKNLHKSLDQDRLSRELKQLVETISARNQESSLQLLPSTGLAIGYFENFITPVCQELANSKTISLEEVEIDVSKGNFNLTIVLPKTLSDASIEGAKKFCKEKGVKEFSLRTSVRSFPFFVDSALQNGRLVFYDYPTTLRASHESVQLALAGPYIGYGKYHSVLDDKEINNFERTLRLLLRRPGAAGFRENVRFLRLT